MRKDKLFKILGLTCLSLALTLSASDITKADNYSIPTGYTANNLVWSDEFSGTSLDTDSWNYEIGNNNGWGNNEKEYYTNSSDNVYIADISSDTESGSLDGKALAIKAKRDTSINDYNFTSGRITTSGKHSFKYGRIEAKIKMENGMNQGVWPAFWMLGYTPGTGWPYCGEIDIMEHANANNYIAGTLHWADETINGNGDAQHKYQGGSKSYSSGNMDTWHTYAVEWDSTKIVWYLDDEAYYTLPMTSTMSEIVNNEFYIILNVAIGGNYIGNKIPLPSWSEATMYVDYVRVYQKETGASSSGTWNKAPIWQNYAEVPTTSNICNVKFMDGNTTYLSGTITKGQYLNYQNMTKTGYTFLGWYTADGNAFDFNKQVYDSELVLYAKWEAMTTAAPATQATVTVKKPSISSIKSKAKRKVTLKLKTKDKAKGFQIKYGTNKKITKKVKTKLTTKKTVTIKKLKSKTTYYFKVREYKLSNGKKVYSKWSGVKKIKVK